MNKYDKKTILVCTFCVVMGTLIFALNFDAVGQSQEPLVAYFPYLNTHDWPTGWGVGTGGQGWPVYKKICALEDNCEGEGEGEDNPIWPEKTTSDGQPGVWFDYDNQRSYFDTGLGQLTWILSVHNPTDVDFAENEGEGEGEAEDTRLRIIFYGTDGVQLDENSTWSDNSQPLLKTTGNASWLEWDAGADEFRLTLSAGESVNIPVWDGTCFFNMPNGGNKGRHSTMAIIQPDGYTFFATIRGNGLHRQRFSTSSDSASTGFNCLNMFSPYMYVHYSYGGLYLDTYRLTSDYRLVVPWFRECRLPATNTNPDWGYLFYVINAGTETGDITITVRQKDGSTTGLRDYTTEYIPFERKVFMPSQFITDPSEFTVNGLRNFHGSIEVKRADTETGDVLPVAFGMQHRLPKSNFPAGSNIEKFRMPSWTHGEPFHILYLESQN